MAYVVCSVAFFIFFEHVAFYRTNCLMSVMLGYGFMAFMASTEFLILRVFATFYGLCGFIVGKCTHFGQGLVFECCVLYPSKGKRFFSQST